MWDPSVRFTCSNCDGIVHEFVELPSYDLTAEREADANGFGSYGVDCPQCNNKFEVVFTAHAFGFDAEISGEPNIDVEIILPENDDNDEDAYEEYVRNYVSNDPHGIYLSAKGDAERLLIFATGTAVENKTFYRLLFVQYFSIVEAYLSDHLVKSLFANIDALIHLVEKHREWGKEKISIATILRDKDAALDTMKERLQAVMYHNFTAVDFNYATAFGFSIFPDNTTKENLIRNAFIRHDCVHRNGRDKDNEEGSIDKAAVTALAGDIDNLVSHIESKFALYEASKPTAI